MKTIFKKFLVICTLFLAIFATSNLSTLAPAYAVPASSNTNDASSTTSSTADITGNVTPCRQFLGLNSWDCNIITPWSGEDILKANILVIIFNVLTDISVLAAYLVIGFVIYGGYQYILASGDPGKVAAGKKTILHAFIGLAIVLLSNVVLNAIRIAIMKDATGSFADCVNHACVNEGDIINNIINWIIGIAGLVSLIFIFVGGIGYMTSAGDPGKLQKAKHTILYACIGLIIVGLSLAITAFVTNLINNSNQSEENNDGSSGYIIIDRKELC